MCQKMAILSKSFAMQSSTLNLGELDTILVPARPVLDDLMKEDGGKSWDAVMTDGERHDMVQNGLCGLLYPDIGHLSQEQREAFLFELHEHRGKMHLSLLAPKSSLENVNLNRISSAGTSIVAGIAYAPQQTAHTREVVKTILGRSEVVAEDPAQQDEISIVFQGGARISDEEYQFAKMVGGEVARYQHARKKFITGGGRGIMRAPHSGATHVGLEQGMDDTTKCGISCGKIIAAEPPNSLIGRLAVFEQIERRLEAFTRSGQLTVLFPGGTGTFEEMLYVLAVLMEEKNRQSHYSFLMVGSEKNREYYDVVYKTLEQALGKDVVEQSGLKDRICIGTAQEVGEKIITEVEKSQRARRQEMLLPQNIGNPNVRMDFHGELHIPSALREPFRVTRENVANLKLDQNQSPRERITNLRRFTYAVTCACISDREKNDVAQNGPYAISGDPQVTSAIDGLMRYFAATKRMNGGEYKQPYTLQGQSAA